jgi:hypothetical protein
MFWAAQRKKCLGQTTCAFPYMLAVLGLKHGPSGLRRGSAAFRLLGLRARIPPAAWKFVLCEWSVLSGRGLCNGLITRPEESYRMWCVIMHDLETSRMRRPWIALGCCFKEDEFSAETRIWLDNPGFVLRQGKYILVYSKKFWQVSGPTKPSIRWTLFSRGQLDGAWSWPLTFI